MDSFTSFEVLSPSQVIVLNRSLCASIGPYIFSFINPTIGSIYGTTNPIHPLSSANYIEVPLAQIYVVDFQTPHPNHGPILVTRDLKVLEISQMIP